MDLKRGSGRPAGDGDELRVRYFNQEGLPGIKAGGKRELVVPGGKTTLGNDPRIYIVEAISVTQAKSPAGSGKSTETRHVQDFWGDGGSESAPYTFVLGEHEVRKGWEIAIPGQRLGTRLELLLPSRLAYGNGPMRYVVELLEREAIGREG